MKDKKILAGSILIAILLVVSPISFTRATDIAENVASQDTYDSIHLYHALENKASILDLIQSNKESSSSSSSM